MSDDPSTGTSRLACSPVSTLVTVIVTLVSPYSAGVPLSVARTLNVYPSDGVTDGSSSAGVQLNAPVAELIVAPAGAPTRLNASVFAGRSGSDAVAVKETVEFAHHTAALRRALAGEVAPE